MKISVITVAYNSEKFIGKTIESVLGQRMAEVPDASAPLGADGQAAPRFEMEYIIIDGGSKDNTVQTAENYRARLEERGIIFRVYSEPDKGIYDAMNKGIRLAEGDVIGILNSDDWYEPDTLQTVADTFAAEQCELMYANIRMHKADGDTFIKKARMRKFQTSRDWNHPTTFVEAKLYKKYPFRDLGIHDDYGFYLQMKRQNRKIVIVDKVLANFRMGGVSNRKDVKAAGKRIMDRYRYCYRINGYSRWYMIECVAMEAAKMICG